MLHLLHSVSPFPSSHSSAFLVLLPLLHLLLCSSSPLFFASSHSLSRLSSPFPLLLHLLSCSFTFSSLIAILVFFFFLLVLLLLRLLLFLLYLFYLLFIIVLPSYFSIFLSLSPFFFVLFLSNFSFMLLVLHNNVSIHWFEIRKR